MHKHNILLVVDTGRNMSAVTATGASKKDTAVMLAGVIGTLALKHGDFIGMVAGNSERNYYLPLKSDRVHLEQLLQKIDVSARLDAPKSNLASQLKFVARNLQRKMMVIIISDEVPFDDQLRASVRRLRAQHEMLWLIKRSLCTSMEPLSISLSIYWERSWPSHSEITQREGGSCFISVTANKP